MSKKCEILDNVLVDEVAITQEEYNNILEIQSEILSMLASHGNFTDILARLCTMAESLLPNSVASIMLVNQQTGLMSVLSAPSIPQVGHDALKNLKPGLGGGSCGNAVFRNEAQYVQDTFKDDRWTDLRQIAYDFDLCSCWSMPFKNEKDEAIGTFALSSFEHRSPAIFHKKLLETAASIVNVVLKNKDNEERVKLFSTAMQNAAEGMIITNHNNEIIEVNTAFEKIYGYKEVEVLGKNPSILASGKHTEEFYKQMWEDIVNKDKWSGEITNKKSNNSYITQWMSVSAINDEKSQQTGNYLAIFSDLTELKEVQSKLQERTFKDTLTNLNNKASLEKYIDINKHQSLILLNVNNFSYINSAYGFEIGDKILVEIAHLIEKNCTPSNIARINSDEFALLFDSKIDLKERIIKIQEYFYNNPVKVDNILLNISFSYGASDDNTNLLRNSSLALKKAKDIGKNRYYIYNKNRDTVDNSQVESFIYSNNLLHNALGKDKIVPYFQGIMDNKTNKITKYEALARIIENGEVISPFVFLEPARLSGLLPEITKVMIEKSFKIMSTNDYDFSINITEEDLSLEYLFDYLDEKILEHKIKSSRVTLEILEGISSHGKKNHIKQLMALKEKGFSIAIDDFGTEYSNFERVLDLEIDFLKVDARYIKDIDTNKKSYEITRAIAYFAKNAGIPCIAEFVHNESVQKIIEELGIDYSQGYLFSEPAPLFNLK